MDKLANSGVKYNPDDVIMISKTPDWKILWLENENANAGLQHIVDGHVTDFAAKGITDIPRLLSDALKTNPINMGTSASGPFADYLVNGITYRVAYGTNGFIVSFYPIGKLERRLLWNM